MANENRSVTQFLSVQLCSLDLKHSRLDAVLWKDVKKKHFYERKKIILTPL